MQLNWAKSMNEVQHTCFSFEISFGINISVFVSDSDCVDYPLDKQLVELVHVKALDVMGVHKPSSLRYQSVTLFLRG